jgi:hypothetical protein
MQCIRHEVCPEFTHQILKPLSSEMDLAESGIHELINSLDTKAKCRHKKTDL